MQKIVNTVLSCFSCTLSERKKKKSINMNRNNNKNIK